VAKVFRVEDKLSQEKEKKKSGTNGRKGKVPAMNRLKKEEERIF